MKLISSSAIGFVLLSPCFAIQGCERPAFTRETALETAERVFANYLAEDEPQSRRSDFESPQVQLGRDGALVGFRRRNDVSRNIVSQGMTVILGNNGCNSLSPVFLELYDERTKDEPLNNEAPNR